MDDAKSEPKTGDEIRREVITVRHTTTTREAIRITVSQRVADNGELALATATITGMIPTYYEKPDLMEDYAMALINSAFIVRKFNKHVIGKP